MDKLETLLGRLSKVRKTRDGYKARCSAIGHHDSTQSLFIRLRDDGIQIKCFAGCLTENILEPIGLKVADLFYNNIGDNLEMVAVEMKKEDKGKKYSSIGEIKSGFKTLEDAYEYNELGKEITILQVRYLNTDGNKQFATFHKEDDGWYSGKPDGLIPLYNIEEIKDAKAIIIVEGEKVCNLLKEYGVHSTCSLGGSNAAENTDWTLLIGKPSIAFWRDLDDSGTKYQSDVKRILGNLNINLRCVDVEKYVTEKGDDLEEYLDKLKEQGLTRDAIKKQIYNCIPKAVEIKPTDYLWANLEKIKNGEIKNWTVPFFPLLTKHARAFKPGSQTVIVSAGGVGKSMLLGRFFDQLTLAGDAKVKRLHLESTMDFYLKRSWAQQSSFVEVLNEEFHYNNPDKSTELFYQYQDVLDIVGETITTSDSGLKKQITDWNYEGVMRWMTANADCDIIAIDPVSMVLDTSEVWKTSTTLTKHAEALMNKNPKLCVIWIQHTAESQSGGNIGGIAGGKAWNKYSSSVLELISNDEPQQYEVMLEDGTITTKEVETYIKIKKARSGSGSGWKIMMTLDQNDLSYKEDGRILKKVK